MNTIAKRSPSPMSEMLDWLEANSPWNPRGLGLAPSLRIEDYEDENAYVVRAELPGVDPEKDIELQVERDTLTISGERREETKEKNRREFHYGSFRRIITLPSGVDTDAVTATYNDGVLEVRIPKTGEASTARHVAISRKE